ncbi:MAG: peptidase [Rhodobacteraceae bacterium]|nr:MAG: peptidase [Paracoccaceae bacterium]
MSDVVTLARGWLGTPYHHRAAQQGAGADCLGLIRGIWTARHGPEPAPLPPYTPAWDEAGEVELLWQALARHLDPVQVPRDGDVLLFRLQPRALAKHLGIQTQGGAGFIHACPRAGIIEAPLSRPWARRIVARFAYPARPQGME